MRKNDQVGQFIVGGWVNSLSGVAKKMLMNGQRSYRAPKLGRSPGIVGKYSSPFNLKKYFEQNDSYTPKTIKKVEEVRSTQTYSPKQEDYSREYRKACHQKCQLCSVDCSEFTGLLHMHHVDGNPANNQRHNLQILCVDCHSKQPMHGHMLRNPQFKRQIDMITKLRIDQGILTV